MIKKFFSFNGRIHNSEYFISLFIFLFEVIMMQNMFSGFNANISSIKLIIYGLINIVFLWLLIAQSAKRCHDLGKSGWWQLVPFYGFVMIFKNGQIGANKYGENPRGENELSSFKNRAGN